jgi:hypothetical protein
MKLIDSYTAQEEKYTMELYNMTMKAMDHDTRQAKKIFKDHIFPYINSILKTMRFQDEELIGQSQQLALLLKSNALLIHALKENGVDIPNLDALARERVQEDGN